MKNKKILDEKLSKGNVVIGSWCEIPSPLTVNVMAKAGLDFIIIDMEHGPFDFTTIFNMITAAEVENCLPFVRVPENSPSSILRVVELAPAGIIVPHIETEKDRAQVISFAKLPPIGDRSFNPYMRAGGFSLNLPTIERQDEDLLLGLIIESKKGVNNMTKIVDDRKVDIVYLGTYDLSSSLGFFGKIKNPRVYSILKKAVKIIRGKGKIAGAMFHTFDEFVFLKNLGVNFFCYKVDTSVIFDEFSKIVGLKEKCKE